MPASEVFVLDPAPRVAYFSMEVAVESAIPTYSGGLGVLAADLLRSAADAAAPVVGVSLVHRQGYFRQSLDGAGTQREAPSPWDPAAVCRRIGARANVTLEGRPVAVAAWLYWVVGRDERRAPLLLLDTDVEENAPEDRAITDSLYGGGPRERLRQEAVLGIGGARLLRALGLRSIETYHMNEGHSALLALEALREQLEGRPAETVSPADVAAVRRRCVFTTHTPVPAGHDRFDRELAERVLGREAVEAIDRLGGFHDGQLNMTYLALRCSRYVNGVGMKHGAVSAGMFPNYPISAVTNGVHAATWASPPFRELFDRYVPQWRRDNLYLRYASAAPVAEILRAHGEAKAALLERIRERTGVTLAADALTIGFARRATAYKRPDLVFSDLARLRSIAREVGPLQFVFGGKAHPRDESGREAIRRIFAAARELAGAVPVVYVEDYDTDWAKSLTSGVDLWLNTPQRPLEASGTSGMKAAVNGVPSLSVLDGWWLEGWIEGVTGWSIGDGEETPIGVEAEAHSLYDKLERSIAPLYYGRRAAYGAVMRSAIALNASYFNTQRMLAQYAANAYSLGS